MYTVLMEPKNAAYNSDWKQSRNPTLRNTGRGGSQAKTEAKDSSGSTKYRNMKTHVTFWGLRDYFLLWLWDGGQK